MEEFVHSLAELDPVWVYLAVFLIAYIENIFPPSPSDVIVVFGGSLVAVGNGHFLIALGCATLGSTLGFATMFAIGRWFGRRIIESGKLRFISRDAIHKAERWFARYGYGLVVANRFLAGTRAVVAFFAGLSELDFSSTILLSLLSALVWNGILVYAGVVLGNHWQKIGSYLSTYSWVVTLLVIFVVLVVVLKYLYTKRHHKSKTHG